MAKMEMNFAPIAMHPSTTMLSVKKLRLTLPSHIKPWVFQYPDPDQSA